MAWTVIQTTSEGTRMSEYLSAEEGLKKIIAQRVEQANDLYALLGEFVVSFELLCQEMRQQLALLCAPAPHRQSDIFALTGEMTAAPLLSSYRSIMALRCREEDRPFFKVLCTRIQRITEQRNNIVHGTWYVGWGNDPMSMFFDAPGVKIKNSSSGPKDVNMTLSEDTFRPFIRECQELHELVFLMTVSVIDGSAVSERCELTGPKGETFATQSRAMT